MRITADFFLRRPVILVDKSLMVCHDEIVESWWWRNDSGLCDRILLFQNHCSGAKLLTADFYSPLNKTVQRKSSSLEGASSHAKVSLKSLNPITAADILPLVGKSRDL